MAASGLWGMHLRSPVHGGAYVASDGVPIVTSLVRPDSSCSEGKDDDTSCRRAEKLSDDAVVCFWLNGNLQNCVLVTQLMEQDVVLRDLERGIFTLRSQLIGMNADNKTFPLSYADTVSFSVVADAPNRIQETEPDAIADPPAAAAVAAAPLSSGSKMVLGCTYLPSCSASDDCLPGVSGKDANVLLDAYGVEDESDQDFVDRARKLLITIGGYDPQSLNPDLDRNLASWRQKTIRKRSFRRMELRRLVARLSRTNHAVNLILGGLRHPLRCSNYGFNTTTLRDEDGAISSTSLFVTGVSILNPRNASDVMSVFEGVRFDRIVLLPDLWAELTLRQAARLVGALRSSLRTHGDVVIAETMEPTEETVVRAAALFEAANMRPTPCASTASTAISTVLRKVVPSQFWNGAGVLGAQCVFRARGTGVDERRNDDDAVARESTSLFATDDVYDSFAVAKDPMPLCGGRPTEAGGVACVERSGSVKSTDVEGIRSVTGSSAATALDRSSLAALAAGEYGVVYGKIDASDSLASADSVTSSSATSCDCESSHRARLRALGAHRVVVLNLKRRPDRWNRFTDRISHTLDVATNRSDTSPASCSWSDCVSRDWRRYSVDGARIDLSSPLVQRLFNRTERSIASGGWKPLYAHRWRRGVLGCALCHLSVWTSLAFDEASSEDTYWLVLEDDVELSPEFERRWRDVVDSLEGKATWDLLYLGWTDDRPLYDDEPLSGTHVTKLSAKPRSIGGGTFAYAIRQRAALGLLEHAKRVGLGSPVDWFMMSAFEPQGIRAYKCDPHLATSPHILFDAAADSDINRGSIRTGA